MLIARWILNEEEIDENSTFAELDEIAKMVQDSLGGNLTRGETVLTTAPEERMSISTEESAPAVTHPAACLRIIDCLKQVLYQQLQFKGNVNDYYKKENSMLHQVYMVLRFKWIFDSQSSQNQPAANILATSREIFVTFSSLKKYSRFGLCHLLLLVWSIFTHVDSIYANLIWSKRKRSNKNIVHATPTGLFCNTVMAVISLF